MNKQQPKSNTPLDRYPGSEMTVKAINEMGSKMEKIILEGLPKTRLFSDAEIVMLQFVGAMICGSLRDHDAIKDHISYFCRDLVGYANTRIKLDNQNKPKLIQTPGLVGKPKKAITMEKCKHYRITFDIISEPAGISRVSDIEHHLYMTIRPSVLLPDSVSAKYIERKVELIEEN